jgi:hypothetical protein
MYLFHRLDDTLVQETFSARDPYPRPCSGIRASLGEQRLSLQAIAPKPTKSRVSFSGAVLEEGILNPGKLETQKRKWMV